jgi:hypothetical protein
MPCLSAKPCALCKFINNIGDYIRVGIVVGKFIKVWKTVIYIGVYLDLFENKISLSETYIFLQINYYIYSKKHK